MDGGHTARAFNDAINRRDVASLGELMTDDHAFIDSAGHAVSGRDAVLEAWTGFFRAFRDYRNVWSELELRGDTVVAIGHSVCATEAKLDGPAIWTATVRGGRVALWRVHDDTREHRVRLGLEPG